MCLGVKAPKVEKAPPPPVVQPAPSRDKVQTAAVDERRRARNQQGVYGNIFTSVLGDPTYNTNAARPSTVAALGA